MTTTLLPLANSHQVSVPRNCSLQIVRMPPRDYRTSAEGFVRFDDGLAAPVVYQNPTFGPGVIVYAKRCGSRRSGTSSFQGLCHIPFFVRLAHTSIQYFFRADISARSYRKTGYSVCATTNFSMLLLVDVAF